MLKMMKTAFAGLLLLWMPVVQAADSGWLHSASNDHAKVRLRAHASQPDEIQLLLTVELQKGWKTYWRAPGAGGIAPMIRWKHPPTSATWHWPAPERFDVSGLSTQGYQQHVTLPIVLAGPLPEQLAGVLTLSTCKDVCILTDYPFSLDLTVADEDHLFAHDFAQAMGQVPVTNGLTDTDKVQAGYRSGELQILAHRPEGWQRPELFFDALEDTDFGKPIVSVNGEQMSARIPVTDSWGESAPDLRGNVVTLVISDMGIAQEISLSIGAPLALPASSSLWWQWVLMALAGGFILNLMPCVLPVLAIKLGSILHVGHSDRRHVRMQFLASSSGIITSFWLLALLMTILRLSHYALGWGIQFQHPWFIGFMVVVTALFSANLLGVFHLQLPSSFSTRIASQGGQGISGHFWQGALATLLATPCSAPFLGTAVAFALGAPLPALWGIFTALGIGMSLPWLLIAAWPTLALRLPRPGRWMNHLRITLGLLMLASCLWLLSLMRHHIGNPLTLLAAIVLLLVLLLAVGRHYGVRTAGIVAVIAGGLIGTVVVINTLMASFQQPLRDEVQWQPLTEAAITQALAENKRVFVDVTADWCVTCKINKINVLLRDDIQKILSADDVIALRGDWSRPSADISDFLKSRGSVAIPFNQVYGPKSPQGEVLSPLLTRGAVRQALADAKGEKQ